MYCKIATRFYRPVYMDFQATTPVDPRVLDAMLPYLTDQFGNPHSRTHAYGWNAEAAVEDSRQYIASLIGADSKEIIFTSGATESNNLALKGILAYMKQKNKDHLITSTIEHKCILDSARWLADHGFHVTYLPVQQNGLVSMQELEKAITPQTALVSIMFVNNEIGVIQPVKEIGDLCRKKKIYFHTDAAQAVGKVDINVDELNIDLLSISAHKLYGPKGIGALYVRRKPRVRLHPILSGGGQERGLRSGTLSPPLCVGLGSACAIAIKEIKNDQKHINELFDYAWSQLKQKIPMIQLNGDEQQRWKGNLNVSFQYVEGESLLMALKDVAVSSGSACTSASLEPSYVLRALGLSEDMAHSSIRIGLGRFTTKPEIDMLVDLMSRKVKNLREMSPLWEMAQEGIDINSIAWDAHH